MNALRAADGAPLRDERGRVNARLAGGQGSHVLSALASADGLAVVSEDAALTNARLGLTLAVRTVLANALRLLGVGAPEQM